MEETIYSTLLEVAAVLRWFGKFREANIIINLAVLCQARKVETADDLQAWREAEVLATGNNTTQEG